MPPSMAPLLGRPAPGANATSRLNQRTAGAVAMGLAICFALYKAIVRLEPILHTAPHLTPLLPLIAIAGLAALLPLGVYLGCADEFGPQVVPWTPAGYGTIARRTYAAFAASADRGGKVGGKDL